MKKISLKPTLIAIAVILFSCAEPAQEKTEETSQETSQEESQSSAEMEMPSESEFELNLIIANNIAAPVKLLTDMNSAGLDHFHKDLLNPTDKAETYATAQEKAIAYGAYGADFSYITLYKQNDVVADYLMVIDKLSDELGMTTLFDKESFERFDRIKDNPDSVKLFIFDKYDQADGFLRDNDRMVVAALILTGGLIESLHLVSAQIEAGDASKDAYLLFLEQKNTLKNLIELYRAIEKDGQTIPVKAEIEGLHQTFEGINTDDIFNKETIAPLHESIDEVRASIL